MLKQKFYEFDKLKEAVNSVFGLDMMERTRKRPHVNARIVFSNILFERGYSKSEIGRYLNKNHATIIHYCKSFEGYVKTDEGYKQERDNQQKDTNRMDGIFKLVSQRTHRGSEDKIMSELNAWFNGIRY